MSDIKFIPFYLRANLLFVFILYSFCASASGWVIERDQDCRADADNCEITVVVSPETNQRKCIPIVYRKQFTVVGNNKTVLWRLIWDHSLNVSYKFEPENGVKITGEHNANKQCLAFKDGMLDSTDPTVFRWTRSDKHRKKLCDYELHVVDASNNPCDSSDPIIAND